ncbi:MAG: leucine-rich repeat protein, partial [Thermoguttaceae bacterium]|nr:leucine-rich repeat protein [Thermoguttaceae bacterium]
EIPKSVEEIDPRAFSSSGPAIKVDPENPYYFSESGILFDKAKETLISYPSGPNPVCNVPETVKTIGPEAFSYYPSLKIIVIPKGVEAIDEIAFANCDAAIDVDPNNAYFRSESGVLFDKKMETLVKFPSSSRVQRYEIPETVKRIANYAFEGCLSLKSVVIPEGVETIGRDAFLDCAALVELNLPAGVETIETYAFHGCSSLTSVVLPESLKSVELGIFSNCSALKDALLPRSVEKIADGAFSGSPVKIRVYKGSYAEYWARFKRLEYEIIKQE